MLRLAINHRLAAGVQVGPWMLQSVGDRSPPSLCDGRRAYDRSSTHLEIDIEIRPSDRRGPWQVEVARWDAHSALLHLRQLSIAIDWERRTCRWSWPPVKQGPPEDVLTEPSLMATMQAIALHHGGMLVHAAGLLSASEASPTAVLVSGASGAGKSTLSARFPGRCIQDDTCIVAPFGAGWAVWYQNGFRVGPRPATMPAGGVVPLRGIYHLGPDRSTTARSPLGEAAAFGALMQQVYHCGVLLAPQQAGAVAQLVAAVPSWQLSHCLAKPRMVLDELLFDLADSTGEP